MSQLVRAEHKHDRSREGQALVDEQRLCKRVDTVKQDSAGEHYRKNGADGKNNVDVLFFTGVGHRRSQEHIFAVFAPQFDIVTSLGEVVPKVREKRLAVNLRFAVILDGRPAGSYLVHLEHSVDSV
jgi:hypothetical protein